MEVLYVKGVIGPQGKCARSHHGLVCPQIADGLCYLKEETIAEIKQLRAVGRFVVKYDERFRQG